MLGSEAGLIAAALGILAVVGGFIVQFFRGRKAGTDKLIAKANAKALDDERKRNELDAQIHGDPDLIKRAHDSGLVHRDN